MMQKSDKWDRANEIDFKHASHTALIVAGDFRAFWREKRRWAMVKKKPTANRRSLVATKADLNSTMFSKGADTWATPLRPSPAANPKLLDAYFLPLQPAARQQPAKNCQCIDFF